VAARSFSEGWCFRWVLALLPFSPRRIHAPALLFGAGAHASLLAGRVLDARTGEPVSDARVRIASLPAETVTDRAGEFRIANLATGAYEVEASRVVTRPTGAS